MKTIHAELLSKEAFRKYGTFQNMLDISDTTEPWESTDGGFYPDLVRMQLGNDNCACASVNKISKADGDVIKFTEYHGYTSEGILPLDGDCIIHVGKANGPVTSEKLRAFYVPKGTMVALNPGVLHGTQIACKEDVVHVLILLPERTYGNDCEVIRFAEEDQVRVTF